MAATAPKADAAAPTFRINPELDLAEIRRDYEEQGRVRVYNFLAEGAVELYEHLLEREDWIHLIGTDDGILELDPAQKAALSPDEWARIEARSLERVRGDFQYRYLALRVPPPDEERGRTDLVTEFARLMRSDSMLQFLIAATGHDALTFTDGQATAYDHGDFLTGHDDGVAGKNRLAAYVFGLTPYWRVEYGGLLLFHGENDRTVIGNVPRFNSLDLFKVPRQHSVSAVSPAAPHRRFTVTGWLRSGAGAY
jgi:SM-20-related protein